MEDTNTFKGIVDFALEKEAEAKALYESLANRIESNRSTSIFTELAEQEDKHYEALKKLDFSKIKETSGKPVPDLKISDFLHDVPYSPDMTYQDILVLAMKSEEHSHSLYNGLAKHSSDPDFKKLFEFLAKQEARHKLRLETEYDDYILTQD